MKYEHLIEYLPDFYKAVEDIKVICNSEDLTYKQLEDDVFHLIANFYFSTMDLGMVEAWENILHIAHDNSLTLEERRLQIISTLNLDVPYTIEKLKEILNSILGINNYSLFVNNNDFSILILIFLVENVTQATANMVDNIIFKIIPAHIIYTVNLGTVIETNLNENFGIATSHATSYNVDFIIN